ncbi:MAG: hypothetical protein KGO01_05655 [Burkholderiales bacterium]|nr:hypothetical protein [Burkholderiales bacterium]
MRTNYDFWSKVSVLKIWEVASIIQGIDPRAITTTGVVVNAYGDPPDLSDEIRMLSSAVRSKDIASIPAEASSPDGDTDITAASLIPWLRLHSYIDEADGLEGTRTPPSNMIGPVLPAIGVAPAPPAIVGASATPPIAAIPVAATPQSAPALGLPDPERRLARLRDLGGWVGKVRGKWKTKGVSQLIAAEAAEGRKRRSDKTVRADVINAAENEAAALASGRCAPLFPGVVPKSP